MATTDTVLQPGAEDLSGFTGPAGPTGPQGATGATGSGADLNILSINCKYHTLIGTMTAIPAGSANFSTTYLIENGTKFTAKASHSYTVGVTGIYTAITGTLSGFLVTPGEFGIQILKSNILDTSGAAFAPNNSTTLNFEILSKTTSSLTWRLSGGNSMGPFGGELGAIVNSFSEIEFNLLITA